MVVLVKLAFQHSHIVDEAAEKARQEAHDEANREIEEIRKKAGLSFKSFSVSSASWYLQ